MFITTRRETARVDAFIAAMRGDEPPTVELPRIIATSTPLGAGHDEPALVDRLPVWALVAVLVAVLAPLVVLLGIDAAPSLPTIDSSVILDTTEPVHETGRVSVR